MQFSLKVIHNQCMQPCIITQVWNQTKEIFITTKNSYFHLLLSFLFLSDTLVINFIGYTHF